ncbi:hypothetical protein Ancab_004554 [Ancistrocladus abbreviatus]
MTFWDLVTAPVLLRFLMWIVFGKLFDLCWRVEGGWVSLASGFAAEGLVDAGAILCLGLGQCRTSVAVYCKLDANCCRGRFFICSRTSVAVCRKLGGNCCCSWLVTGSGVEVSVDDGSLVVWMVLSAVLEAGDVLVLPLLFLGLAFPTYWYCCGLAGLFQWWFGKDAGCGDSRIVCLRSSSNHCLMVDFCRGLRLVWTEFSSSAPAAWDAD